MEFGHSFFLLLLSFFMSIFMLQKLQARHKPKKNLPPGPWKLPLIGNLHLLAGSDPPHRILRDLAKKYGPLMHLQLGEVGTVIVSSPKTAKDFLKTHDIIFASRPTLLATEISCYGNTDIAFAPYGEYWRQLRKICTLELLSAKRVQSFLPVREEEVSDLCKWIAVHEGSPINLTERISRTNYDIMLRAVLGKKTKEQATFIGIVKESVEFMSVFRVADVYPSIKFFHLITGLKKKIEKLHQKSDRIVENIIQEHKRANAARINEGERNEDLLYVLLKIQDAGSLELPLTTDNIKSVLMDLFGAGIETSATTVDWAMVEMLKNPRVLNKGQEEVRRVFHGKICVKESYFDELKYLKLVIKETLRMHPPAPLLLPRESRERCEINGYEIPARTRVLVNVWAMGKDPKYWEDAESFKPERFLEKSVDFKASSFEYLPFGAGRRICPGISFGLANVELLLAMFLYHFDWILPNGMKPEDMDMTEFSGVAARRKDNLIVIPVVKRPLPAEQEQEIF